MSSEITQDQTDSDVGYSSLQGATEASNTAQVNDIGSATISVANAINSSLENEEESKYTGRPDPKMDDAYFKKLFKTNSNLYYMTPEVNDILYLQC